MLLERRPVRDNRPLEARDDVLAFTSEPLDAGLLALGPVSADIRLRSSRGDADVFVRVCDVHPDGASLNVCDGLVRLTPDAPARDDQRDRRRAVRAVADGALVRGRPPHPCAGLQRRAPRYARNPGTGEDPARASHLVTSDQEVLHDPEQPSCVTLTVATS